MEAEGLTLFSPGEAAAAAAATRPDAALDEVEAWFGAQPYFTPRVANLIRQGLDEVIDGGRTGRWSIEQLEKTEKTYVGTKMEILVRSEFDLPREKPMDTVVCGHPVDIKWTANGSAWQIPKEAIRDSHICFLVSANERRGTFRAGLVRCHAEYMNKGEKQGDKKKTLSAVGRSNIRWLADGALAPNYLSTLPAAIRDDVMAQPKGQPRVTRLFTLLQRTPVPRLAVVTLAQQPGDPMRRIRKDKSDRLKGLVILGGHYQRTARVAKELGYVLARDEYMSVPRAELVELGIDPNGF